MKGQEKDCICLRESTLGGKNVLLTQWELGCRKFPPFGNTAFLKIEIQLTYNIVSVLGVKHNDLIYVYIGITV